ncbi:MAG: tetratricopeptide repeat-containing sensor histidine kinase [Candidatus Cloacimonetes bacterium]|nr:tetratricopeptide repeat-containing sensor histidine kinase [Candidatus Cloacimonadota bacterium]
MKKMLIFTMLLTSLLLFSDNTKIDSLQTKLAEAKDLQKIEILIALSREYVHTDSAEALKLCIRAIDIAANTGKHKAKTRGNLGYIYYETGNYKKSKQQLSAALKEEDINEDQTAKADILSNLGLVNYRLEEYEESFENLDSSLKIYIEFGDKGDIAQTYYNIGLKYDRLDTFEKALENYNYAKSIAVEDSNIKIIASSSYNTGNIYILLTNYGKALEAFYLALEKYEDLNDHYGISNALNGVGNIYLIQEDYDLAIKNFNKTLTINQQLEDDYGMSASYNNLGVVYDKKKDHSTALEYYKKALEIDLKLKNKHDISGSFNNIGTAYFNLNNYEEALSYYNKSLVINEQLNDKYSIATNLNNFAVLFLKMKNYTKSLDLAQRSLTIANDIDAKDLLLDSYNTLSKYYLATENYKNAYDFYKKYTTLKDSIFIFSRKEIAEIQITYETEKREKKIELLKKSEQIKILELQNHAKTKIFLIIIKILIIIVALILFRLYRTNRKSSEFLKSVINSLQHPFYVINVEDYSIELDNSDIESSAKKKKKKKCYELIYNFDLPCNKYDKICSIEEMKKTGKSIITEQSQFDKNNVERHFEIHCFPIFKRKKLEKIIKYKLDITDRRKAENEIKIGRNRLQMLNKIIRHDLANDFVVINSAVRIFRHNGNLEMINEIAQRVTSSLKTIKKYKEFESFINSSGNLNEMEIIDILNEIVPEFSKIKFNIKGKCKVYADEALNSVFTNLISNSIKHGASSLVNIIITSERNICKITFMDNGSGIQDEIIDRIFDEGFHYGKSGNTGIGLYIVKNTIERFGGSIAVDFTHSVGTAFVITLRKVIKS